MSDELEGGNFTAVEGRDGFLFLGSYDGADAMRLYTDPNALNDKVYDVWREALHRRTDYFRERGISYLTLVIPDACLVYTDKLPDGVELAPRSPFERLEAMLDEPTRRQCVYLRDELIRGRDTHETFPTTDSHWTDWGAWLGYQAGVRALAPDVPNIGRLEEDRIEWSTRRSFGAFGVMMEPERSEIMRIGKVPDTACAVTRRVSTEVRNDFLIVEQDRPDLPTAVVFRDSFMTNAHQFFSESFRRIIYVSHQNRMFFDLIEAEQPDVVIVAMCERRLRVAPDEPSVADFRMEFGDLMLDHPDAVAAEVTARSLLRTGDLAGALAANDEALTLAAPTARLWLKRSQILSQLHELPAAVVALRTAAALDPTDAPVHYFLAQALRQHGLAEDAFTASLRATELDPRLALFWPFAVTCAIDLGDHEAAADISSRALAVHPGNPDVLYARSRALVGLDDLEGAEAAARQAHSCAPESGPYLGQLASVLIRRADWNAAAECLAELQRIDPDSAVALSGYVAMVEKELANQS